MTDIPTQPQPLLRPTAITKAVRIPAALLKRLFKSRRANRIDQNYTSEHLLNDITVRHTPSEKPIVSLGRRW